MLGASVAELERRAASICSKAGGTVVHTTSSVGGGSLPGETLPSAAVAISSPNADELALRLRTGAPSVFPFIRDETVLIDLRTVRPQQDQQLSTAIQRTNAPSARE
jgi:L-seryl-tRNA(Ser) seleniumtransferase